MATGRIRLPVFEEGVDESGGARVATGVVAGGGDGGRVGRYDEAVRRVADGVGDEPGIGVPQGSDRVLIFDVFIS